jgi:hypothetical protein
MGVCFDSQSADNMSPHELSEAINRSIEKSWQGTSSLGGNTTATPGMLNSVLKPVSDYMETTSPSNPIPVPSKTTKDDINAHGENKKPASKIPPHDMVAPLITETITEMTGINFRKMIDDAYIVGGGIDINSHSLWNYRTIHALWCVKKHLAKLAYRKFGSDAFKGDTIDDQRQIYLGAIWLVAEAPLCLQGTASKTQERINKGAPIKAVGFGEPVFIETFKHYLNVGLQLFYQEMRAVSKVTSS